MRRLVLRAAVAAAALPFPALLAAQQPERGAFVVLLGRDTIAVERFVRTGSRVDGEAVNRSPQTVVRHWSAQLGTDGGVTSFTYHAERVNRSLPPTFADMTFGADTVQVRLRAGGRDTTLRMPATRAVPFVFGVFGHYELALRQAAAAGGDSAVVSMIAVGAAESTPLTVRRVAADSVAFDVYEPNPFRVHTDRDGRILGVDGLATTAKVMVRRVADVDIDAPIEMTASRPDVNFIIHDQRRPEFIDDRVRIEYICLRIELDRRPLMDRHIGRYADDRGCRKDRCAAIHMDHAG